MEPQTKGTVTPIASLFSEEEAKKAESYVEVKIGEKREEMNRLQQFVDENDNRMNLVKKLPDQLHHNVMVPFGKIAFFPGRLIHTNECLVLLGENYYTDRTSKQTADILKRRDKTLQSQIHSLKAEIEDFQTEASFFTTTASEAAEGLLEIREEYEEADSSLAVLQPGVKKESSGILGEETAEGEIEDDDFARIMSRLNELEMEEEKEGEDGDDRSEEHDYLVESVEESELNMVNGLGDKTNHNRIDYDESAAKQESTITISVLEKVSGHSSSNSGPRLKPKEVLSEKHPHKDFQATSAVSRAKADSSVVGPQNSAVSRAKADSSVVGPQKIESPIQKPEPKFDTNKAFTGSIIEHTHNLETNTHGPLQPPGSKPSKPVSRFKAQRR